MTSKFRPDMDVSYSMSIGCLYNGHNLQLLQRTAKKHAESNSVRHGLEYAEIHNS